MDENKKIYNPGPVGNNIILNPFMMGVVGVLDVALLYAIHGATMKKHFI